MAQRMPQPQTRTGATIDDLYKVEGKAEIVDGEIVLMAPAGFVHGRGAPIFAVEVRSEEDYGPAAEKHLAAKRADYFAAGARVVWDVDFLRDELVRSYSAERPEEPRVFRRGETADAEPALPGWSMTVDSLFKANPRR